MTSPTPPSRRRPGPPQQAGRRPRVAGLRQPRPSGNPGVVPEADEATQIIPKIPAEPTPSSSPLTDQPTPRRKARPVAEQKPTAVEDRPVDAMPDVVEDNAFTGTFPLIGEGQPVDSDPVDSGDDVVRVDELPENQERRSRMVVPVVLAVVAVLIGGLAAWFGIEWAGVRSSAESNTALSDVGTTSEVTGQISAAVNATFSFDYTNLGKTQKAVQQVLTGTALCQYNELFKQVRQQAPTQKLVLTTTVQKQGVELLQGDTARVLLLVQQHDTRATTNQTSDSQSMIAVNAVKQDGKWKISGIDTFSGTAPTPGCQS